MITCEKWLKSLSTSQVAGVSSAVSAALELKRHDTLANAECIAEKRVPEVLVETVESRPNSALHALGAAHAAPAATADSTTAELLLHPRERMQAQS